MIFLMFQCVEFPMSSNNFSFARANRRWDLLAKEGLHRNLFIFDKVSTINFLLPSCCPDMLTCCDLVALSVISTFVNSAESCLV